MWMTYALLCPDSPGYHGHYRLYHCATGNEIEDASWRYDWERFPNNWTFGRGCRSVSGDLMRSLVDALKFTSRYLEYIFPFANSYDVFRKPRKICIFFVPLWNLNKLWAGTSFKGYEYQHELVVETARRMNSIWSYHPYGRICGDLMTLVGDIRLENGVSFVSAQIKVV